MNPKELAGIKAARFVEQGMKVGLGTGSTVYFTLLELGRMVRNGMKIQGVATSDRTVEICGKEGIPLVDVEAVTALDLYLDGADEVDPGFSLIKGGGGALFREKRVASLAGNRIIIVDESKIVPVLGKFPLPVEVVPFGWQHVFAQIQSIKGNPRLRLVEENPYLTDNGNYILDCYFQKIPQPEALHSELKAMIGVVETGLFFRMAENVIVGKNNGEVEILSS